jgi:hypothetical protein
VGTMAVSSGDTVVEYGFGRRMYYKFPIELIERSFYDVLIRFTDLCHSRPRD